MFGSDRILGCSEVSGRANGGVRSKMRVALRVQNVAGSTSEREQGMRGWVR